jgi:hypothetical protein
MVVIAPLMILESSYFLERGAQQTNNCNDLVTATMKLKQDEVVKLNRSVKLRAPKNLWRYLHTNTIMFKLITLICLALALALWIMLSGYEKEDFSMFVERRVGNMVKADSVSDKGITVRVQLYDIARYKPERVVRFACKSALTTEPTNRELGSNSTALSPPTDSEGWIAWLGANAGPDSNMREVPPWDELPLDRIHIVSAKFAYIDVGSRAVGVTFDGCRTVTSLPGITFEEDLFAKNELKHEFEMLQRPFFTDYRLTADESGVCFRIDPWYVNQPYKGFDFCTMNSGASWYTKEARGLLSAPAPEDVDSIYSARLVNYKFGYRTKLFSGGEITSGSGAATSPFLIEHRFTPDTNGVCSRIHPMRLTDPKKGFDLCTADNGATWYTKVVNGPLMPPSSEDAVMVYSATTQTPTFMPAPKPTGEPSANTKAIHQSKQAKK